MRLLLRRSSKKEEYIFSVKAKWEREGKAKPTPMNKIKISGSLKALIPPNHLTHSHLEDWQEANTGLWGQWWRDKLMDEGRCDFCSLLTHILIGKLYCSLLNRLKDGASSRLSLSQLLKSRSTILLKAPIHQGTRLEDFPGKPLNLRSALRAA